MAEKVGCCLQCQRLQNSVISWLSSVITIHHLVRFHLPVMSYIIQSYTG